MEVDKFYFQFSIMTQFDLIHLTNKVYLSSKTFFRDKSTFLTMTNALFELIAGTSCPLSFNLPCPAPLSNSKSLVCRKILSLLRSKFQNCIAPG